MVNINQRMNKEGSRSPVTATSNQVCYSLAQVIHEVRKYLILRR